MGCSTSSPPGNNLKGIKLKQIDMSIALILLNNNQSNLIFFNSSAQIFKVQFLILIFELEDSRKIW